MPKEIAMSLENKRVVIIGGTSGIGLAVARGALAQGAQVVVGSSHERKVSAAKDALPGAEAVVVDVTDEASVASFFGDIGAFDHLVFTAGDWDRTFGGGPLDALDLSAAASMFAVRFWGAVAAAKHAHKKIRAGGSITLTDGMIAHSARKGAVIAGAMAGAIEHLTRALAVELAPVRVNAVCPGLIKTDIWNGIPVEQREETWARMTKRLPLNRIGEPSEAAEAYLYLMRAGYTSAQVLRVDGGQTAL
jgi:NAD(P)-dependent dehydrogenase (short-subunit alcohol dehydrogenase family)